MFSDANAIIKFATTGAGNTTAWDRLAEATDTFGGRLSGSPALNSFIAWAAAQATVDGLRVTLEPVMVPHWVRGAEWAQLESPRAKRLHFCGAGYSNNTGGAPITAPVLVVGSFEELQNRSSEAKGKICLFDWPTWECVCKETLRGPPCSLRAIFSPQMPLSTPPPTPVFLLQGLRQHRQLSLQCGKRGR
jgi:hypothetical protein